MWAGGTRDTRAGQSHQAAGYPADSNTQAHPCSQNGTVVDQSLHELLLPACSHTTTTRELYYVRTDHAARSQKHRDLSVHGQASP